jgi:hypothetical protein
MRIFQILSASTNDDVAGNQVWRRQLHDSLVDLGHDVVLVPADEGRRAMVRRDASLRAGFSEQLVDRFREESRRRHVGSCPTWATEVWSHSRRGTADRPGARVGGSAAHESLPTSRHRQLRVLVVGAWLGKNPEQVVVVPRRWLADPEIDTTDVTPPEWIRL